mgnify:CR=1 FL=1
MKKITFLLLTILPLLGLGQTTIENYTFDTDVQGWAPGNAADTSVNFDAANYYTASGSIQMEQLTVNKVIKVTGITSLTDLGDYTLKFKIKGIETGANIKGIIRTTTNYAGDVLTMNALPASTGGDSDTWYEYSTTITIPTLNTSNTQIQIQTNTLGTYYIDDVQLIQEPLGGSVLTANVVGGGTITATPDQVAYDPASSVTLTAVPATHWNFDSWSGDLTGTNNPETLLMDTDKTVTANFSLDPTFDYAFTFDTDGELEGWEGDASVTVSGPTSGLVTLSLTANSWSRFNLYDFPIPATVTDPSKYNKVTIKLQNLSSTTDQIGLVIDGTTTTYDLGTNDTAINTYDFDLTAIPTWTGDVTSFRIRFADADNPDTGKPSESHDIIIDDIIFSFDATLSKTDNVLEQFSMYPNPTKGKLNLVYQGTINSVQVFDITGNLVMESGAFTNTVQLNISNLNQGIYLVKLQDQNQNTAVKKLIVQ